MNREFKTSEAEELVERMLADQLDARGWSRLTLLAQDDPACREYVELHHTLLEADSGDDLPDASEFAAMRAQVIERTGLQPTATPGRKAASATGSISESIQGWVESMFQRPVWAGAMAAVLTVAIAGAGWWVGRQGSDEYLVEGVNPSEADLWMAMREEAIENQKLTQIEDSPYLFSNVSFADVDEGRIELQFDVTRHIRVNRPTDDPLVKEAMAQTLINRVPVGEKLRAIEYAGRVASPKIREGLLFSMLNDPQLAVRLRAQAILLTYEPDAELQAAFLAVLTSEESMQMRLEALDYLAASDLAPERRVGVLSDLDPSTDSALLMQAADHGWVP